MSTVATRGGAYLAGHGFVLVQLFQFTRSDRWDGLEDIEKLVGILCFGGLPLAGIWSAIVLLQKAEKSDKDSQIAARSAEKSSIAVFGLIVAIWALGSLDPEVPASPSLSPVALSSQTLAQTPLRSYPRLALSPLL